MSSYTERMEDKKQRLGRELKAITTTAGLEGREHLTSDEREKFHRLEAEYTGVEAAILASGRVESIEQAMRHDDPRRANIVLGREEYTEEQIESDARAHKKIFTKYLRFGPTALDEHDKRVLQRMMPDDGTTIRNALTVTSTGGGYVIPQAFSDQLEEALKWYSGVLGTCGEFTTATGAPLEWPTVNDTSNPGVLININTQVSETDLTFGQASYGDAYNFSSGLVLMPEALVRDSFFDLDPYLAKILGKRLGRVMNSYLSTGTGSSQPTGIQTAVIASGTVVQGTTGETTSVGYTDLDNLIESVDEAYLQSPSCGWMFSQSTRKAIRKLVDGNNRPLWAPGLISDNGQEIREKLLDFPYTINPNLPAMAANAYPILFGDFSKYVVRRVAGGTTVLKLVERYADFSQVGFIGYTRADGQLLDSLAIAAYQNSAS